MLDPEIQGIRAHIASFERQIREIQDRCSHPYLKKRHFARSPFEYCVTHHIEYHCPQCDKRWTVDAGP